MNQRRWWLGLLLLSLVGQGTAATVKTAPGPKSEPALPVISRLLEAELRLQQGERLEAGKIYFALAKAGYGSDLAHRAVPMLAGTDPVLELLQWLKKQDPTSDKLYASAATAIFESQSAAAAYKLVLAVMDHTTGSAQSYLLLEAVPEAYLAELLPKLIKHYPQRSEPVLTQVRQLMLHTQYEQALALLKPYLGGTGPSAARAEQWHWSYLERAQPQAWLAKLEQQYRSQATENNYLLLLRALSGERELPAAVALLQQSPQFSHPALVLEWFSVALQLEQFDLAKSFLDNLAERYPQVYASHYQLLLGYWHEYQKRWAEALSAYEKVPVGDSFFDAKVRAAWMQLKLNPNNIMLSSLYLGELYKLFPNHQGRLVRIQMQLYSESGQHALAYQMSERYNGPDLLAEVWVERGLMQIKDDRIDEALLSFRRAIELDPKSIAALNALGYSLADRNEQLGEAEALLQQALFQDSLNPAILDSYGWLKYRQGQLEQARWYLERSVKRNPDPESVAHLIEVLVQQGQKSQALALLEQGENKHPGNNWFKLTRQKWF